MERLDKLASTHPNSSSLRAKGVRSPVWEALFTQLLNLTAGVYTRVATGEQTNKQRNLGWAPHVF